MILLRKHKIIALKARKVAGTSFEIALSRYASEDDIITPISETDEEIRRKLGYPGPQNYYHPIATKLPNFLRRRRMRLYWNHMPPDLVMERIGDVIFNSYKKIAIIRNPFEVMISMYFFHLKNGKISRNLSFQAYVLSQTKSSLPNGDIYDINGKRIIDYMIRYNRLSSDIEALEEEVPTLRGLSKTFNNINAKGNIRPKEAFIHTFYQRAPRAVDIIFKTYRADIERYDFSIPSGDYCQGP